MAAAAAHPRCIPFIQWKGNDKGFQLAKEAVFFLESLGDTSPIATVCLVGRPRSGLSTLAHCVFGVPFPEVPASDADFEYGLRLWPYALDGIDPYTGKAVKIIVMTTQFLSLRANSPRADLAIGALAVGLASSLWVNHLRIDSSLFHFVVDGLIRPAQGAKIFPPFARTLVFCARDLSPKEVMISTSQELLERSEPIRDYFASHHLALIPCPFPNSTWPRSHKHTAGMLPSQFDPAFLVACTELLRRARTTSSAVSTSGATFLSHVRSCINIVQRTMHLPEHAVPVLHDVVGDALMHHKEVAPAVPPSVAPALVVAPIVARVLAPPPVIMVAASAIDAVAAVMPMDAAAIVPLAAVGVSSPECIVCFDRPRNCILDGCPHLSMCMECAADMKQCPICRADILFKRQLIIS